ncbi:unnamed protein product [Orchesella dallaii]|uniref:Carboxylesterase type B domain-containing protein n=1 Tax=Orchesella dallaii TaxID=48710 RepID=A0ABP1RIR8_9HEXA
MPTWRFYMLNLPVKMSHRHHNLSHLKKEQYWTGVWDAASHGNACTQWDPHNQDLIGDEDWLYVTVFTPMTHSDRGIPIGITGLTYCTNGERYGSAGIQWDPLNKEVCVDNN